MRSDADTLIDALRPLGDPGRAAGQRAYLKSDLTFLGCTVGQSRAVLTAFLRERPALDRAAVRALATDLWAEPVHDRHQLAVLLLSARSGTLGTGDLGFLEGLIRTSYTWAYVDGLAGDVAGNIVLADPVGAEPVLDRWAADPDFWVRRSALLALLILLKRTGVAPWCWHRFARYADAMADEKEFFVRKAIGWVLREVAKPRPDLVAGWLAPRMGRVSGVTLREAVKYLPPEDRARLLAAR